MEEAARDDRTRDLRSSSSQTWGGLCLEGRDESVIDLAAGGIKELLVEQECGALFGNVWLSMSFSFRARFMPAEGEFPLEPKQEPQTSNSHFLQPYMVAPGLPQVLQHTLQKNRPPGEGKVSSPCLRGQFSFDMVSQTRRNCPALFCHLELMLLGNEFASADKK